MTDQTWLITGISGGFGRIMTEKLLARGDRVAGTLRKPAAVDDLKSRYGDRLWTATLDVTDIDAVHRVVERAFADSAYNADRVKDATPITIDIVTKIAHQVGFKVLPRRWVVERTFAWLNRNRRLAKDVEATIASAATFLYAASVMLLTRRLARSE